MPQIRSSDLRQLHSLMMKAHWQNEESGYEVWADTLTMFVFRRKNGITEYTTGVRAKYGELVFKPMDSEDDRV